MEILKEALKQFGVSEADIANMVAENATIDSVKPIVEQVRAKQRELFKNDPEIIEPINNAAEGRIKRIVENKIKKTFELSNDEIKDLKFEEIIDLAKNKVEKTPVKEAQEVQEENIRLKKELQELKEVTIPEIETKYKETSANEINRFKVGTKIGEFLNNLYAEEMLIGKPKMWQKQISEHLLDSYGVNVSENEINILTKEGLKVQNKDKTSIIGFEDVIKDFLDENGGLVRSNGSPEKKIIPQQTPEKKLPPSLARGIDAAMKNLEKQKAEQK